MARLNDKMADAKRAKNDEFYTLYEDIQKEINAYLEYNPDVFRDKTVLLPCDDPEWSNFTRFFAQNFENFGLKKLISTSYAADSKPAGIPYQLTLFEMEGFEYDESKTIDDEIEIPVQVNGKLKTTITINLDEDESSVKEKVHSALEGKLDGKSIVKEIYVKNKIFNVVVK